MPWSQASWFVSACPAFLSMDSACVRRVWSLRNNSMTGRLALDFGTSNSVVAVWDERLQEGVPLHIPEYGRFIEQNGEQISIIPSLIHYDSGVNSSGENAGDERRW